MGFRRALAARVFRRGSPTIHVTIEGMSKPSKLKRRPMREDRPDTRAVVAGSVDRFWAHLAGEDD